MTKNAHKMSLVVVHFGDLLRFILLSDLAVCNHMHFYQVIGCLEIGEYFGRSVQFIHMALKKRAFKRERRAKERKM